MMLVADHHAGGQEEAGAGGAVEQQQNARGKQHGETQQPEDGGHQPGPAGERHAHQGHALAAQIHRGGDEIDRAHQRGAAEDRDAEDPQVLAHAFAGTGEAAGAAQRRIGGPAGERRAALHEERRHHHHQRQEGGPERHHVQHRERHVLGADLDGQEVVAETALRHGGQHEEHHDGAVHGHQRKVQLGRHHAARRGRGPELGEPTAPRRSGLTMWKRISSESDIPRNTENSPRK